MQWAEATTHRASYFRYPCSCIFKSIPCIVGCVGWPITQQPYLTNEWCVSYVLSLLSDNNRAGHCASLELHQNLSLSFYNVVLFSSCALRFSCGWANLTDIATHMIIVCSPEAYECPIHIP